MNKIFLVVRVVLLVALLFLLASVFWGLANRTNADSSVDSALWEKYNRERPAGYTSILLVILIVLGICVVVVSIFFEYRQARRISATAGPGAESGESKGTEFFEREGARSSSSESRPGTGEGEGDDTRIKWE